MFRDFILSPQFLQRIDFSRFKTVYAKKSDTGAPDFYKSQVQDYIDSLPNTLVMIRVRGIQGRTKLFSRSRYGSAPAPTPSSPHYGKHRIRFRGSNRVYGTDFPPQVDDKSGVTQTEDWKIILPKSRYYKVEVTTAAFDSTVNQIRLVEMEEPESYGGKGYTINADFTDDYGMIRRWYSPWITMNRNYLSPIQITTFGTVSESSPYLHD